MVSVFNLSNSRKETTTGSWPALRRAGDHRAQRLPASPFFRSVVSMDCRLTRDAAILPRGINCLGPKWLFGQSSFERGTAPFGVRPSGFSGVSLYRSETLRRGFPALWQSKETGAAPRTRSSRLLAVLPLLQQATTFRPYRSPQRDPKSDDWRQSDYCQP